MREEYRKEEVERKGKYNESKNNDRQNAIQSQNDAAVAAAAAGPADGGTRESIKRLGDWIKGTGPGPAPPRRTERRTL